LVIKTGLLALSIASAFVPPFYPGVVGSVFGAIDVGFQIYKIAQQIELQLVDPYTYCKPTEEIKNELLLPDGDEKAISTYNTISQLTAIILAINTAIGVVNDIVEGGKDALVSASIGVVTLILNALNIILSEVNDKADITSHEIKPTDGRSFADQSCIKGNVDSLDCAIGFAFCSMHSGEKSLKFNLKNARCCKHI
jgi:hypothetical protein